MVIRREIKLRNQGDSLFLTQLHLITQFFSAPCTFNCNLGARRKFYSITNIKNNCIDSRFFGLVYNIMPKIFIKPKLRIFFTGYISSEMYQYCPNFIVHNTFLSLTHIFASACGIILYKQTILILAIGAYIQVFNQPIKFFISITLFSRRACSAAKTVA